MYFGAKFVTVRNDEIFQEIINYCSCLNPYRKKHFIKKLLIFQGDG